MSTQARHTPGPWHRNIRADGKYPVVFAGRNQHVATVSQQEDGAETEANIDLVSAAPELLAALEGAIGALEFSLEFHRDLGNSDIAFAADKLDAAVKAIAKARGQS